MTELEEIYNRYRYPYVEVRRHKIKTFSLYFFNGNPISNFTNYDEGYSVRFFNGTLYFTSANKPDDLGINTYKLSGWEMGVDTNDIRGGKYKVEERKSLDSMDVEEKIKLFQESYERVKDIVKSFTSVYIESIEEKDIIVNGVKIEGRIPRIEVFLNFVLKEGDRSATARYELGASGGLEVLLSFNLPEYSEERVKEVQNVLRKGRVFGEKRTAVVLSSMLAGIMAHESVGHPFEADRVLGRELAQAGSSYLSVLSTDKIGSSTVNVIDDPTIPGSFGFYKIDDEGTEARPKYLIKEGKRNELLTDRFAGYRLGLKSNGSARASNYNREPLIRMSNTYFKPGDMKFEELLDDIKEGVFIKSYMEWNIDDMRLGQRYVGLEAYEIRNGELSDPVLFPVLEGQTPELLSSIDAVDNNLQFYPGTCGKGDPDQGIPVWLGGPDMRLRNVRVKVL